ASDDPTVALACGAAMAAGPAGDATAMAPAVGLDGAATAMAPAVGLDGAATAMAPAVGLDGDATAMAPAVGYDGDATAMAPAVPGTKATGGGGRGLAYSMAGDAEPLAMAEEDDDEADTGPLTRKAGGLGVTDVVLGIAVAGSVARLALVGPAAGGVTAV